MGEKVCETRKIMGGTFLVQTWAKDQKSIEMVKEIIIKGFELIYQLEDRLTDFRDSPFNKINDMAGKDWVRVDRETYDLIKSSIEISRRTKGAFDISYASIGRLWREARAKGTQPIQEEIKKRLPFVDYNLIEFKDKTCEVYLPNELMKIGLGGIGKGYAVDKLYEYLQSSGLSNFLISGAGDVRVHSLENAPRSWRLAIKNPFSSEDKTAGYVELKNGSLATSGDYINYLKNQSGNEKLHHILGTKTGMPAVDIASCSIIAEKTLEADTMATTIVAMKSEDGMTFLNQQGLFGIIIRTNGQVLLSKKAMAHYGDLAKSVKVIA